ncbi:glutamine amidotransferase [Mesorhizobium sp. IMUNJ 23232]|uniref:glutamine amidotransferase n=1 Tax=Mesorhizobium sp. IMUNJ 23232 TaxID=3376064 RepID=UPI003794FCF5
MQTKKILLAGETFALTQFAAAGVTAVSSAQYANGALPFLAALEGSGIAVEQLPGERCSGEFPASLEALASYRAVILSDVSALSPLLTPQAREGRTSVDRLDLLERYVAGGGSLMMAGGYTSFQGMFGTAAFHGTAVEDCLPVACLAQPDGVEAPAGLKPAVTHAHPITNGLPNQWPPVLGLNRTVLRATPDTTLLASVTHRGRTLPLLAVRDYGKGLSLAFTTDIGPHWMSRDFLDSDIYRALMLNIARWLVRDL